VRFNKTGRTVDIEASSTITEMTRKIRHAGMKAEEKRMSEHHSGKAKSRLRREKVAGGGFRQSRKKTEEIAGRLCPPKKFPWWSIVKGEKPEQFE